MLICIKFGNDIALVQDAFQIREMVFIKEQGISREIEMDKYDRDALHLVIYIKNKACTCARMIKKDGECQFGRIAVLKKYRGRNLGRLLIEKLCKEAFKLGETELHIHSQICVMNFYKKLGFETYGDRYFEANIEHINMILRKG